MYYIHCCTKLESTGKQHTRTHKQLNNSAGNEPAQVGDGAQMATTVDQKAHTEKPSHWQALITAPHMPRLPSALAFPRRPHTQEAPPVASTSIALPKTSLAAGRGSVGHLVALIRTSLIRYHP